MLQILLLAVVASANTPTCQTATALVEQTITRTVEELKVEKGQLVITLEQ